MAENSVEDRLRQIDRCTYELEKLRATYKVYTNFVDKYNNLWGELDWLDELHTLLYDYRDSRR